MASSRVGRARSLRRREGLAARKLWEMLRGGRCGGLKFRREHPIGPYSADFACDFLRLVVEVDGGIHMLEEKALDDRLRQQEIEALGWTVLRFTNEKVLGDGPGVLAAIRAHARETGAAADAD